jgi:PAS domain S-box-containing protein
VSNAILALLVVIVLLAFGPVYAFVILRRQQREYRLTSTHAHRLRNFLLALSRANRMILREQHEAALWNEACSICVETGQALLACVYVRDGDVAQRIATAGPASRVLENVPNPLPLNSPDLQHSYTVRALNSGARMVSNDYVLDGQAGRWREEAVAQGIRAIAWIPLTRAGKVDGVLMLCAGERGFFDEELLALLDELGEDLSFALDNIDRRRALDLAQQQIKARERSFQTLFDAAPVPMAIVSIADRRILEANIASLQLYGLDRDHVLGTATSSHTYGALPEDRDLFYRTLSSEGHVRDLVLRIRDAQGVVHHSVFNGEPIDYLGQACCLVTAANLDFLRGIPEGPSRPP